MARGRSETAAATRRTLIDPPGRLLDVGESTLVTLRKWAPPPPKVRAQRTIATRGERTTDPHAWHELANELGDALETVAGKAMTPRGRPCTAHPDVAASNIGSHSGSTCIESVHHPVG